MAVGKQGAPEVAQIPADAVRLELERVLASRSFAGSKRLSAFLRFVVELTLGGESAVSVVRLSGGALTLNVLYNFPYHNHNFWDPEGNLFISPGEIRNRIIYGTTYSGPFGPTLGETVFSSWQ
jgi:hypothetical protein